MSRLHQCLQYTINFIKYAHLRVSNKAAATKVLVVPQVCAPRRSKLSEPESISGWWSVTLRWSCAALDQLRLTWWRLTPRLVKWVRKKNIYLYVLGKPFCQRVPSLFYSTLSSPCACCIQCDPRVRVCESRAYLKNTQTDMDEKVYSIAVFFSKRCKGLVLVLNILWFQVICIVTIRCSDPDPKHTAPITVVKCGAMVWAYNYDPQCLILQTK